MRITIDTREDSKEEIRKAIDLLTNLMSASTKVNKDIFSSEETKSGENSGTSAFANMFGSEPAGESKETPPNPPSPTNQEIPPSQSPPPTQEEVVDLSILNKPKEEVKEEEPETPEVTSY